MKVGEGEKLSLERKFEGETVGSLRKRERKVEDLKLLIMEKNQLSREISADFIRLVDP